MMHQENTTTPRPLRSPEMMKNLTNQSVMPPKAGIQCVNARQHSRNLDSGMRRNDTQRKSASVLTLRPNCAAMILFLLVSAVTLSGMDFAGAQGLEKVRIGMPSLSLSFIAPQVAYARGFF